MSEHENNIGRRLSMYEMLTDKNEVIKKVLIPKIQRDYAQGRESSTGVRNRFLKSIFDVIDTEQPSPLTLDFIFGHKEEETNIFYPVDGQQRLTTLFLLQLYVGRRGNCDVDFLRKFSYETRDSSKQFCKRLFDIPVGNFKGIRKYVEDQWWFTNVWRNDPTIKAMLTTLDDIDKHYEATEEKAFSGTIWPNLLNSIKFWLLYLDDLITTDDLYIKMNSRGVPLTNFEHIKAMLDEYAHTKGRLSAKIDTVWTGLLWRYHDFRMDLNQKKYMDNGLDKSFTNLLTFYLNVEGAKLGLVNFQYPMLDLLALMEKVLGFHPAKDVSYTEKQLACAKLRKAVEARQIMRRFEKIMDFFCERDSEGNLAHAPETFFSEYIDIDYPYRDVNISATLPSKPYKVFIDSKISIDLLSEICMGLIASNGRNKPTLYIEAFFEYAVSFNSVADKDFRNRLRMVRNLIENTEIHADEFDSTLKIIDFIVKTGQMSIPNVKDEINNRQRNQETFKLQWIQHNPLLEDILKAVENHRLINGNINVLTKVDSNGNQDIDILALQRFGHLFHSDADYMNIERSLLTIDDYTPQPQKGDVRLYGGWGWTRWREFIQSFNTATGPVLCQFLNQYPSYDANSLFAIINDYDVEANKSTHFPWRYYLAKYPAIFDARFAKYRYRGSEYSYLKLNANGGGGREQFWNPFNRAVEDVISFEYKCRCSTDGGPLILIDKNIAIDVLEHHIKITYPTGYEFNQPIPYDITSGIDCVDRIVYTAGVCRRVFNTFTPTPNQKDESGEV
ncbi:MAG: DUF262 domain-containing protein [Muribaculum sp.]|nr:DUF262 domain-containing protein [Muribaculum sp.]